MHRISVADTRGASVILIKREKNCFPLERVRSKLFKRIPRAQFSVELASKRNSFHFFEPRQGPRSRRTAHCFQSFLRKINLFRNLIPGEVKENARLKFSSFAVSYCIKYLAALPRANVKCCYLAYPNSRENGTPGFVPSLMQYLQARLSVYLYHDSTNSSYIFWRARGTVIRKYSSIQLRDTCRLSSNVQIWKMLISRTCAIAIREAANFCLARRDASENVFLLYRRFGSRAFGVCVQMNSRSRDFADSQNEHRGFRRCRFYLISRD